MESKDLIRNLVFGSQPSARTQTIANIIGGAVLGGGLLGLAYGSKNKTYEEATTGVQNQVNAILPSFDEKVSGITKDFNSNLAGYETRAVGQATGGLTARGITDTGVARETAANVKSGLSGAYAAARAALSKAKLQSTSALGSAMANYKMGLADKQYQSMLQDYYAKMGIWGSLGGLGVGIAGLPSNKKAPKKEIQPQKVEDLDNTDYGLLNKEGI